MANPIPAIWHEGDQVDVGLILFGSLWVGKHTIEITRIDDESMIFETSERDERIRRWNHSMQVIPIDGQRCFFVDRIDFDASFFTRPLLGMVHVLYRHRHTRLQQLLGNQEGLRQYTHLVAQRYLGPLKGRLHW